MLSLRRTFPALLAIGLALGGSTVSAQPAATPSAAQQFVEQRQQAASQLLRRPAGEARNRQLQQVFHELLDYPELARRSLGRHWGEHTDAEKQQFTGLLEQLVERAYQDNLQRTLNFEVRFTGSEQRGDATIVHTEARSRTNRRAPAVAIDYHLRNVGGHWRVFDIDTDGVSLVANYRSQFNRIIGREGWAGLIQRMQTRVSSGGTAI